MELINRFDDEARSHLIYRVVVHNPYQLNKDQYLHSFFQCFNTFDKFGGISCFAICMCNENKIGLYYRDMGFVLFAFVMGIVISIFIIEEMLCCNANYCWHNKHVPRALKYLLCRGSSGIGKLGHFLCSGSFQ